MPASFVLPLFAHRFVALALLTSTSFVGQIVWNRAGDLNSAVRKAE